MLITNSDANNHLFPNLAVSKRPVFVKTGANQDVFFQADQKKDKKYENPIHSSLEYLDAAKLTAGAGLVIAGRFILDFFDPSEIKSKKDLRSFVILSLAIGAAAAILSLPKNLYKSKVETFKKKKEMDVYVRSNSAEQKLYERLDSEAKKADEKRKDELKQDYLMLKTGKNLVPEFIKKY
jgi:ribosomal protein S18 acetylase RimI-like enzyme